MVIAVLPEASSDGGAFLLDDGSLVGDGLGRSYVADELLYCTQAESATPESRWTNGIRKVQLGGGPANVQELILADSSRPSRTSCWNAQFGYAEEEQLEAGRSGCAGRESSVVGQLRCCFPLMRAQVSQLASEARPRQLS